MRAIYGIMITAAVVATLVFLIVVATTTSTDRTIVFTETVTVTLTPFVTTSQSASPVSSPISGEQPTVVYNYTSSNGRRYVSYSNGTNIDTWTPGVYRNSTYSAYFDVHGIKYPRNLTEVRSFTKLSIGEQLADVEFFRSLLEKVNYTAVVVIRSNASVNTDDRIIAYNVKGVAIRDFKLGSRSFTGVVSLTADLIDLDDRGRYSIKNLELVIGDKTRLIIHFDYIRTDEVS